MTENRPNISIGGNVGGDVAGGDITKVNVSQDWYDQSTKMVKESGVDAEKQSEILALLKKMDENKKDPTILSALKTLALKAFPSLSEILP